MRRLPFATRLGISIVGILLVPDVVTARAQVCSIHERQKLIASDGSPGDWFGRSVSISGNWVIIAAPYDDDAGVGSGSAYVFRRDDNGTPLAPDDDFWVQEDKLLPSDGSSGDVFGSSVSISGERVIIGAFRDDDDGHDSGSAYVFRRDDNGTPSDPGDDFWVEENKLTASDGYAHDYFGLAVSISGDRTIVGAGHNNDLGTDSGSAYVFRRDDNGTPFDQTDDFWIEEAKLLPSDGSALDQFGRSVSMNGARAMVGADQDDDAGSNSGSAYVFRRDDNGTPQDPNDDLWIEEAKLTASDAAAGDRFGDSVAIAGSWAIVGASGDDDGGDLSGSAYIFQGDDGGTPADPSDDFWVELQKLTPLDTARSNQFGTSVSTDGNRAVIGASWSRDNAFPWGSAYVYRREDDGTPFDPSDDFWVHQAWHTASSGNVWGFGGCVSMSGNRAIVGAFSDLNAGESSGSAYVFGVRIGAIESCEGNDVPDECEADCNENGVADVCDVIGGTSDDCNANNTPDECETDCNGNGIPDDCDTAAGTSADCNANDIPDECETDCNANGIPDDCDITDGTSDDCNANGIPDECDTDCNINGIPDDCDIASATSEDCSGNGIPDECEPDCNANAIADSCDLHYGTSTDCNNDRPDECDIADGASEDLDGDGVPDECAEIRWRPAAADQYVVCLPGEDPCGETEIMLSGGGVVVTLFLEVAGWDRDQDGDPVLGAYQGTVDGTTYLGGLAPGELPGHPGNPGTLEGFNLSPVGWDTGEQYWGAYHALKVCGTVECVVGGDCVWDPFSDCEGNPTSTPCREELPVCIDRPDYVFFGLRNVAALNTTALDYFWLAASPDCAVDDGTFKYGGTLLLDVPAGATGTYNVGLVGDLDYTMLTTCDGPPIWDLARAYGQITIVKGRCCSNIGVGTTVCEDDLSQPECDARPGLSQFAALESCSGPEVTDCNDNGVPDDCEPDDDGDGVINPCDACPDDPNKTEPGICGCGLDDNADGDGDGVPDCFDECPGVDDALFATSCVDAIPTVSAWGLAVLTLLLLAAGKVCFTRRRDAAA